MIPAVGFGVRAISLPGGGLPNRNPQRRHETPNVMPVNWQTGQLANNMSVENLHFGECGRGTSRDFGHMRFDPVSVGL